MSQVPHHYDPITPDAKTRKSKLRFEGEPAPQSITARNATKKTAPQNQRSKSNQKATRTPAEPVAPQNRTAWDDVALRTKLIALVALSSVGGVLVGMFESQFDHKIWPLLFGVTLVVTCAALFAISWIAQPFDMLIQIVAKTARPDRPNVLSKLPTNRTDEVGDIARLLHKFSIEAVRDFHDAKQLRRTLDDRIEHSTRKATHKLQQLAMRDPLTTLGNRRFIEDNMPNLFDSCKASHADLICIAIDMDNFKKVNDQQGHAAGDELIIFLGNLIRGAIRHEDVAARLGGDEFVILMPGCTTKRAGNFGNRLIKLFHQHVHAHIRSETDAIPGLSIGIASTLRDTPRNHSDLLERSDANLYQAKRKGKGCVVGE